MKKVNNTIIVFLLLIVTAACTSEPEKREGIFVFDELNRQIPVFSGDSAYTNVQKQLEFGPRVPGTQSHTDTRNFLINTLRDRAGRRNVFTQDFSRTIYGDTLQMSNIIAAFNLEAADRIFLCAHWDTRPRADRDPDITRRNEPIPGADDGASGVAVLLEIARILAENPPPIGVDLVLFDGEDYGREGDLQYYFLGAREWAENPPVPGYRPRFGILLDMVGAKDAVFPKELYSLTYARPLVDGVWEVASGLGYGNKFPDIRGAAISDDHVVINEKLGIPTINIIHHNRGSGDSVFPEYWHTHADNLDIISEETLGMIGHILTEIIYNRIK
ncbi:MAG: M28 family peptidase [Balneolaceae bacterium]|nr:MAG: M28 family peptidase [Balneolaceae bacterium]